MKELLRELLTESDNSTHSLGKYLAVLALVCGIGYAGYDLVYLHNAFDMTKYGIGIGSLFAGVAAWLGFAPEAKK